MKFSFPVLVSIAALVLAGISLQSSRKTATEPREITNQDWIQTVPNTPGASRFVPLSESLELLGYTGFRFFARLPAVHLKPGEALYYLRGTNVYQGPPDKLRVISKGLGVEDILKAGGSPAIEEKQGFEYTVAFRRDVEKGGLSGISRFGFISPTGRVSGGEPFSMKVPLGSWHGSGQGDPQIQLGKEIEFFEYTFAGTREDGQEDLENAITVKWYFAFQVGPQRGAR